MLEWLKLNTNVTPMETGHRIIEPKSTFWTPFYIIRYISEAQADYVRG
jgi:hypothetical protein